MARTLHANLVRFGMEYEQQFRADALFFLQAARIDHRRNEQEVREKKHCELARYVVTYADGKTAEIPVVSEVDVDDYKQRTPPLLPGAQLAWT